MIVCKPLERDFTVINNALLRDERLSIEATAVMTWLLSKPRDWVVQVDQLRKRFRTGRERMQRVMRELVACGWVVRRPARAAHGSTFAGSEYVVFNVPRPVQAPLAFDAEADPQPGEPPAELDRPAPRETGFRAAERESVCRVTGIPTPYQERTLPRTDSSEPDGSGPGEPAPGRKLVFSEGRPMLVTLGLNRRTAGEVIGRWLSETEDPGRVLDAIRSAREHGAKSPIPWINAHLQPRQSHVHASGQPDHEQAHRDVAHWLRELEASRSRAA